MASVDSGVETENDSNDSSVAGQENRRSMDQSPASNSSLRDSRSASENSFFSGRDPMPSTSQDVSNQSSARDIPVVCELQLDPKLSEQFKEMVDSMSMSSEVKCVPTPEPRAHWGGRELPKSPTRTCPLFTLDRYNATAQDAEFAEAESSSNGDSPVHIDAPAGLSFQHIRPTNGLCGTGQGYQFVDLSSLSSGFSNEVFAVNAFKRLKAPDRKFRNRNRHAHQAIILPLTTYYERNLRRAVSNNNIETVETLLNSGVNPNAADEFKRAPLHLAACRGYIQILQLLLDRGANPNQKDSMGNTALHLAACTNNVPVVTLLLKAGTDVCSLDQYGRNPLQLAQTRLKMLQATAASNPDAMQVKSEVQNVIDMMQIYLHRIGSQNKDAENELLTSFSTRLTLSQTSQEVDHELRGLLASLSSLNIGKTANQGLESIDV